MMSKISHHFGFIAVVFGCLTVAASNPCPNGWTVYEDSCYYFGHTAVDFNNAEIFCGHYHANLVEVESANESNFLTSYLTDLKDPNHWLGLTDAIIEGEWKWYSDDSLATYTDWGPAEPNNGKAYNCAITYGAYAYKWVDVPCSGMYKPLCEINLPQPIGTTCVPEFTQYPGKRK